MMENKTNYDTTIGITRATSVLMIIICHVGTANNISSIGQLFQVGVQVFIFISGLLYGNRRIANKGNWYITRIIKLCIPTYSFVLILIAFEALFDIFPSIETLIMYLTNLQGIHHIVTDIEAIPLIIGAEHLWFITVILLCYLIVLLLNVDKVKLFFDNHSWAIISTIIIFSIFTAFFRIRIDYFWLYLLGIWFARKKPKLNKRNYIAISILMLIGTASRLIGKKYCDLYGDTNWYINIIIPFVYNIIAVWFYLTVSMFRKLFIVGDNNKGRTYMVQLFRIIDKYSFCIYIVHYVLLQYPFNLLALTENKLLNYMFFVVAIIALSILLKVFSDRTIKFILLKTGLCYDK